MQNPSSTFQKIQSAVNFKETAIVQFTRYFLVALVALLIDTGTLSFLIRWMEIPLTTSAALAFFAGTVANYLMSVKLVFKDRQFENQKFREFLLFATIGIVGLLITQAILEIGYLQLKANLEIVKIVAAGATFIFNFLVRKIFLF
ncbi:GtrA family protein [Delftia deserti]|uniref:GtrA family protein n=1 Tax=Delftia deserti TaxID=1651218 RepID=A0ABW5F4I8_9BURK